jgi:Bacterial SH3 domain
MAAQFKVNTSSLNFRSAPIVDPDNVIKALPKGQIVTKLEVASNDSWWKVSTNLSGEDLEGFLSNRFLAPLNDPFEGKKVVGMANTSQEFRDKVVQIADRLKTQPIFLMAVMSFETGGTFSPKVRNRASGATGLIQFIAPTAQSLGTSLDDLAKMTALEQLDIVEQYLKPFKGRLLTIEDAYMSVLYPKAIGKGRSFVLFESPTITYAQNKGLDLNDSGKITVAEAATLVESRIV